MVLRTVLRRIFGPTRGKVTGGWRQSHSEEHCNVYPLLNIIRMTQSKMMRWKWHMTCIAEKRNAHKVLVGKPEENRPF
jgi:hypothetical protein